MTSPLSELYREIPLTLGKFAVVDVCNYERLNQWKWHTHFNHTNGRFYAVRKYRREDGTQGNIWMHREILGLAPGDPRTGDHIKTEDTLRNTLDNLRIAVNGSEQQRNRPKERTNTSGYKGVTLMKKVGNYQAQIKDGGVNHYLGVRDTAEAAWRELYVPAAMRLHGKFARTE
jgi:hypothetical protein